jgi:hypothetical protein
VIPRYDGDVPDPVGGIRHVIPGKGNYLTPSVSEPKAAPPALDEPAFLQRVLALVSEGRKVATYKPALLLALMDACARRGATRPGPVTIPGPELAELVIESYWPQVRPYPEDLPGHWYRLRQAPANGRPNPAVLMARPASPEPFTACARRRDGAGWATPTQVRLGAPASWGQAVRAVAEALAKQPIPRLQRPGSWTAATGYEPFLYDDSAFGESVSATQAMGMSLTLHPCVAAALVRAAPLLRPAVQTAWTSMVANLNQLSRGELALRGFLFGAARTDLAPVRQAMQDLGVTDCFWCGARLRADVHVDHVLPWAHFPTDALFNLVLADQPCNLDKRDVLVGPELLARWVSRPLEPLDRAAEALSWRVDRARTVRTAIAAYTWMPDGVPLWHGPRRLAPSTAGGRSHALDVLARAV